MEIDITDDNPIATTISAKTYNVMQINMIADLYKGLRQQSKAPTFALSYAGTIYTLMKNCGFTEEEAQAVFDNFHSLYFESAQWIRDRLEECCKDGYATVAFGLRIRTPVLERSILNTSITASISSAEARSVGNAISGQSYGLLNNRAAIAFMNKVWASEFKYDIFAVSLIHDAIYLMARDDIHVLKFINDNLIEEMQWQELPEIAHPDVKLGAELDIYHPSWASAITLPNYLDKEQLKKHIKNSLTT